jgi:hypothetical protein
MLFRPQDRKLLDRQQEGGFMRFVTEDEMQERDDKLRAEWHEELRRALEAMREQEDLGASYRWGLNAALNTLDATLPQPPEPQPLDPLSPAAFVGRKTPDGKSVRWVAWTPAGSCNEYSTEKEPKRINIGFSNGFGTYGFRPDLNDPARAGQTLFVGQGPDPRGQKPALTLADIPAELRAEIEAAERERVAQWFDVDKWEWEAGRVRALGPREVKP